MRRTVLQLRRGTISEVKQQVPKKTDNDKDRALLNRALSNGLQIGTSISLPIVAGVLFGRYLDTQFNTSPKLTLSFLFLGVLVGGYSIIRLTKIEE